MKKVHYIRKKCFEKYVYSNLGKFLLWKHCVMAPMTNFPSLFCKNTLYSDVNDVTVSVKKVSPFLLNLLRS
jgi:hypothetical protein